jgi:hypothetical protein
VRRDPLVRFAEARLKDLHELRMRSYAAQKAGQQLLSELDSAVAKLDAAQKTRDSTSAAYVSAKEVRAELTALQERLRGQPRRAAGAGAGGAGGGQSQSAARPPVLTRLSGVASAIGSAHFPPTPEQRRTVAEADEELQQARSQSSAVLARAVQALATPGT